MTMREWPLFLNFPVTVTLNLNLSLFKYGCTEHLSYSNQDLGVQCPTSLMLDFCICEESRFTKFRTNNTPLSDIFWWGLIVLLVLTFVVTETE